MRAVAVLVLGSLLWSVQPAYANLWDWLQEFSGPGPFHARLPNWMIDICPQKNQDGKKFLGDFDVPATGPNQSQGDNLPPVVCFYTDLRFFQNADDDNFGVNNVKIDIYEFGASSRLHRAVSLGFGAGLMRIATPSHTAYKGVFTAPRVVIKPLLLYGSNAFWNDKELLSLILGSIKFYVKEDVVLGHMRGEDFGLTSGQTNFTFDVHNDRVASTGFIIDLSDLVARGLHRR